MFQSAPPRGGRPHRRAHPLAHGPVSIRAPAWGATFTGFHDVGWEVFQSAPPRGGRRDWIQSMDGDGGEGRFNPRPRVGGDLVDIPWRVGDTQFQSAPPRGGRPPRSDDRTHRSVQLSFNPRPRVGGDATDPCQAGMTGRVSIRAPAWGATWPATPKFTFQSPWGALPVRVFQSAPPRGGRRRDCISLLKNVKFARLREPRQQPGDHACFRGLASSSRLEITVLHNPRTSRRLNDCIGFAHRQTTSRPSGS